MRWVAQSGNLKADFGLLLNHVYIEQLASNLVVPRVIPLEAIILRGKNHVLSSLGWVLLQLELSTKGGEPEKYQPLELELLRDTMSSPRMHIVLWL